MEKAALGKIEYKGKVIKNRFFSKKGTGKLIIVDKLVKIQNLIASYTHKASPLQSRKNLLKAPLKLPSSFQHRTKSCDLFKFKLPALKFDSSKIKFNIRYLSKDFDDEENKNCIITPEESWKSTKRLYQEDNLPSKLIFKPVSNEDSNRTQDTCRNPQTTRRSSIKYSRVSLI